MAGRCLCCAAHGFACTVTVERGGERRTVLFDTGPDALVLLGNAAKLGIDWGTIDAIVLSHGHSTIAARCLLRSMPSAIERPAAAYRSICCGNFMCSR